MNASFLERVPIIIQKIIEETPTVKSFYFHHPIETVPGQFVMLTDYETGEKPFSFSFHSPHSFAVTLRAVGAFTEKLHTLKEGDTLFLRGPYGRTFTFPENLWSRIVLVGGGCGTAPLRFLLHFLMHQGYRRITFINGGRTSQELLFQKEFSRLKIEYHSVTDDGSLGARMNTAEQLAELLKTQQFDYIYTAGPEIMMKAVYDTVKDNSMPGEFLLERYMKCGVGICGQCTLDPVGIRMCVEGPVVSKADISKYSEFGTYTRDAYGKRVSFFTCQ